MLGQRHVSRLAAALASGPPAAVPAGPSRPAGAASPAPGPAAGCPVTLPQTVCTDSSSTGSSGSTSPFHSRSARQRFGRHGFGAVAGVAHGCSSQTAQADHCGRGCRHHRHLSSCCWPYPSAAGLAAHRAKGPPAAKSRSPGGHPAAHAPSSREDLAAFRSPVTRPVRGLAARSQVAEGEVAVGAGVPAGEELADGQG